ncbi:hypothetical protein BpHYR1_039535 [Brachionus plicatilis]|uniref:Uncharacterized protein n=1 Tax=Brachionus plicatilis TaxID=10195 RepID=A0A3M7SS87_BRAPC|nr:hypothetical protein BpHYR1_039535 [Brachionus plicatilis]
MYIKNKNNNLSKTGMLFPWTSTITIVLNTRFRNKTITFSLVFYEKKYTRKRKRINSRYDSVKIQATNEFLGLFQIKLFFDSGQKCHSFEFLLRMVGQQRKLGKLKFKIKIKIIRENINFFQSNYLTCNIKLEKNSYSPDSENSSLNSYSYSANSLLV